MILASSSLNIEVPDRTEGHGTAFIREPPNSSANVIGPVDRLSPDAVLARKIRACQRVRFIAKALVFY